MESKTISGENLGFRQRTHNSVDRIMNKAESMTESGKEKMLQIKEKAAAIKGDVDDYIRASPEKSVLIAAGVGAVLGAAITAVLLRRRQ